MLQPHPTRPLTAKQQQRRQRILSATRELVAMHGYTGMIMRDVAIHADVSPTTLYNLYNTKDELLLAALRDKLVENLSLPPARTFACGYDYFAAMLKNSVHQTLESPAYAHAITQALMNAAPGDRMVVYLIDNVQRGLRDGLEAMLERSELVAGAPLDRLAQDMTSTFWGSQLLLAKGALALADLETTLNRQFLSLLIPTARPVVRRQLEAQLAGLDCDSVEAR